MDNALPEASVETTAAHEKDVAVAVITPSGEYPDEDTFRRAKEKSVIQEVLNLAAEKLHLTNTSDWVAKVDGKKIDPSKTFKHEGLAGIVEIEWHKHEGGGGA